MHLNCFYNFRLPVLLAFTLLSVGCAQIPMEMTAAEKLNAGPEWPEPTISSEPAPQPAPPTVIAEPLETRGTAAPARSVKGRSDSGRSNVTTTAHPDVWQRVRSGFQMPRMDSKLVQDWENYYSSRPEYFARMIANSGHFMYHVAEEVERRGMPLEIALLPMIESAFNPVAYSSAHASGIWQFIPSTGKNYGLRQNGWYDGRRDVIAATGAALDYLQKLYSMFNDWELALASYNWGEGAVQRAVERNQARGLPTDYQSLTNMPAETRNYIPKLLAVKNIIADPARFGLTLAHVPNEPYFEVITVKRHIDVELAAKFAEMPLDEFKFLNPAHNRPVINADTAETILLPKHKVPMFLANMASHEDQPLTKWQAHVVRAGERPETIAARYNMTVAELNDANGIGPRKRVTTGQTLLVPLANGALNPQLPELPAAAPVSVAQAFRGARNVRVAQKTAARPGTKVAAKTVQKGKVAAAKPPARKVALAQPEKKQ
jgi:membrane-bound lytic murein transglycosylase D